MSDNQQKYIVVFKKDATQERIDQYASSVESSGGTVTNKYGTVLKGFAAQIPDSYLESLKSDSLQSDSPIDYIEPDGVVTTQ
ncbi:protease propeptide/inhibitor [Flagelloscypha sp. PMI_526]|nr:protease propeptide/inhibitor [Flagelloscypha sp. PMI_526]